MVDLENIDKKMPILVADDYLLTRNLVKAILKSLGFSNIHEAENGTVALYKLRNEDFSFVICDWYMPNLMGIDVLRTIRCEDRTKDIPFLMLTAEGQKANVVEAMKEGVSNYVIKPFSAEILATKIEEIFQQK